MAYGFGLHGYGKRGSEEYASLAAQLTGRNAGSRKLANNTHAVRRGPRAIAVRLHATDILTFYSDGRVEFRTGGWETVTTKARLNQFGPPGFTVGSNRGEWYLSTRRGGNVAFFCGITVNTRTGKATQVSARHAAKVERDRAEERRASAREKTAERRTVRQYSAVCAGFARLTEPQRAASQFVGESLAGLGASIVEPAESIAVGLAELGEIFRHAREVDDAPPADALDAWHFIRADHTTGHGGLPVRVGQTLHVWGDVQACGNGLHASLSANDAASYCGPVVCHVKVWGAMDRSHEDKIAAEFRHVVWMADASALHSARCILSRDEFDAAITALAPGSQV